jgi:DHA2 family multidrug resistance protein-like MFS transporter
MSVAQSAGKATRREWIGLAVIALPCLLYSMDLTVLNLAVPTIVADLKPTASQLLWIVDIYGFLLAGWLITMGTLGDRVGRRKLLLIGAAAFAAASVLAAFARSAETLIAARALLGVAGATLGPSTLSLIRNMFLDDRQRTVAIGIWIASFSAGGAIGPLVGGVLLEYFHWSAVFLVAVPIMAMLMAVGPFLLPEYRDPNAGKLDIPSAALSIVAVLGLIYAVKRLAEYGGDWWALASAIAGLVFGLLFIHRQTHLADPLIDLKLFRSPAFSGALAVNALAFFSMFGIFLFVSQYLQFVLGMSPLQAGLWTAPSGVAFVIGSAIAPMIAHRFRAPYVTAGGLLVVVLGFALMTQVGGPNSVLLLMGGVVIMSLGMTPVVALATDLIVAAAPPERAGAASAISETTLEFHGALGIAVLGSVLTVIYRTAMAGVLPADLPPAVIETASGTLGGALSVAPSLPPQLQAMLTDAARAAYVDGFIVLCVLCGLFVLAAAGVTLLLRDKLQPPRQPN